MPTAPVVTPAPVLRETVPSASPFAPTQTKLETIITKLEYFIASGAAGEGASSLVKLKSELGDVLSGLGKIPTVPVDSAGRPIVGAVRRNAQGQAVDANGNVIEPTGLRRNALGEVVDDKGNVLTPVPA